MRKHIIKIEYDLGGNLKTVKNAGRVVQKNNLVNVLEIYVKTEFDSLDEMKSVFFNEDTPVLGVLYCKLPNGETVSYPKISGEEELNGAVMFDANYFEDGYARIIFTLDRRCTLYKGNIECSVDLFQDTEQTIENNDNLEIKLFEHDVLRSFFLTCEESMSTEDVTLGNDEAEILDEIRTAVAKFSMIKTDKPSDTALSGDGTYRKIIAYDTVNHTFKVDDGDTLQLKNLKLVNSSITFNNNFVVVAGADGTLYKVSNNIFKTNLGIASSADLQSEIDARNSKDVEQDARMSNIESKNVAQDTAIEGLNNDIEDLGNDLEDSKIKSITQSYDASNGNLKVTITLNDDSKVESTIDLPTEFILDASNPPYMDGTDLVITFTGGTTTRIDFKDLVEYSTHTDSDTIHFTVDENHNVTASVKDNSISYEKLNASLKGSIQKINSLVVDETTRQENEIVRQSNEQTRQTQELARESAEQQRENSFEESKMEVNGVIQDYEERVQNAEQTILEEYELETVEIPLEDYVEKNELENYPTFSQMNDAISFNTAYDRGTYTSPDDLPLTGVTNNDFAYVEETDSLGVTYYRIYRYNEQTLQWVPGVRVNNTAFTTGQWAAINSGITAEDVANFKNKMERVVLYLSQESGTWHLKTKSNQNITFQNLYDLIKDDEANHVSILYGSITMRPQYVSLSEIHLTGRDRDSSSGIDYRIVMTATSLSYATFRTADKGDLDAKANKTYVDSENAKTLYNLLPFDTYSDNGDGTTTITRRTGVVDLNSLGWNYQSSYNMFLAELSEWSGEGEWTVATTTLVTASYKVTSAQQRPQYSIGKYAAKQIFVKTNETNSIRPSGTLYYELATPYTEVVNTGFKNSKVDEFVMNEYDKTLNLIPTLNHDPTYVELDVGTYVLEFSSVENASSWRILIIAPNNSISSFSPNLFYYGEGAYLENNNGTTKFVTFTVNTKANFGFYLYYGNTTSATKAVNPRLYKGSTALSYHPYNGPIVHQKDIIPKIINRTFSYDLLVNEDASYVSHAYGFINCNSVLGTDLLRIDFACAIETNFQGGSINYHFLDTTILGEKLGIQLQALHTANYENNYECSWLSPNKYQYSQYGGLFQYHNGGLTFARIYNTSGHVGSWELSILNGGSISGTIYYKII